MAKQCCIVQNSWQKWDILVTFDPMDGFWHDRGHHLWTALKKTTPKWSLSCPNWPILSKVTSQLNGTAMTSWCDATSYIYMKNGLESHMRIVCVQHKSSTYCAGIQIAQPTVWFFGVFLRNSILGGTKNFFEPHKPYLAWKKPHHTPLSKQLRFVGVVHCTKPDCSSAHSWSM